MAEGFGSSPADLRAMGFSSGDFVPHFLIGGASVALTLFSSNWTQPSDGPIIQWDNLVPPGMTVQLRYRTWIDPGTDETVDVRIRNATDGETVESKTGFTSTQCVVLGPVEFEPSTTSAPVDIQRQYQGSGNNSNTMDVNGIEVGTIL